MVTKFLALFSILSVGFLIAMSRLSPNGIYMWFASSSMQMDYIRVGVIALILIYLMLGSYTHIVIKSFLILLTIVLVAEVVMFARLQGIGILDFLSLALAGVTTLVLTFETKTTRARKLTNVYIPRLHLDNKYTHGQNLHR